MSGKWRVFPFTALVGQEKIKRALLANAVLPSIGGVLLRGEKGTAKSTAVRGLASLLPQSQAVAGCPWHCDPLAPEEWLCPSCAGKKRKGALPSVAFAPQLADVPLSASEDRVAGSLDMEAAFREGVRVLQPGLLAAAHRGILYIDEVNLLPDHVADVILEACSEGVNRIRREGISAEHPSRFVLVGTMNPERPRPRRNRRSKSGTNVPPRKNRSSPDARRMETNKESTPIHRSSLLIQSRCCPLRLTAQEQQGWEMWSRSLPLEIRLRSSLSG